MESRAEENAVLGYGSHSLHVADSNISVREKIKTRNQFMPVVGCVREGDSSVVANNSHSLRMTGIAFYYASK